MKELTTEEFFEAPGIIQKLYVLSIHNIPVGWDMLEECHKEHPEYFPYTGLTKEEVEIAKEYYEKHGY